MLDDLLVSYDHPERMRDEHWCPEILLIVSNYPTSSQLLRIKDMHKGSIGVWATVGLAVVKIEEFSVSVLGLRGGTG